MLIADITHSPDDGGYYATVWNNNTGKDVAVIPPGDEVVDDIDDLKRAVCEKYGPIEMRTAE